MKKQPLDKTEAKKIQYLQKTQHYINKRKIKVTAHLHAVKHDPYTA